MIPFLTRPFPLHPPRQHTTEKNRIRAIDYTFEGLLVEITDTRVEGIVSPDQFAENAFVWKVGGEVAEVVLYTICGVEVAVR